MQWGSWMQALNPGLFHKPERPNDLKQAYWFLAPDQVAVEFWIALGLCACYLIFSPTPQPRTKSERSGPDCAILLVLCASYGLLLYHKIARHACLYMLQPCHMVSLITVLSLLDNEWSGVCFNLSACLTYNPLLALLFPETSSYKSQWEVRNYWLEHVVILLAPFLRVAAGSQPTLIDPITCLAQAAIVAMVWHFHVLTPISLYCGCNINMVLVPHKAMLFLGRSYRVVMWLFCSWFIGPILVSLLSSLSLT